MDRPGDRRQFLSLSSRVFLTSIAGAHRDLSRLPRAMVRIRSQASAPATSTTTPLCSTATARPGIGGVCCNEDTDFMRHMTHALDVCGEDHVGIDTDLSVAALTDEDIAYLVKYLEERRKKGIAAPGENRRLYIPDLNTPRRLERVADAPQKQGCGSRTVEKVLGPNFNRVYRDVWTV